MGLQLTTQGQTRFLAAVQDEIRQAKLIDADGSEIEGWGYEPRQIEPDAWEGTSYEPGLNWIFIATGQEPAIVIAGLAWANELGDTLAMEPLVEPFIVNRTGDTLVIEPVLRLFGVVGAREDAA